MSSTRRQCENNLVVSDEQKLLIFRCVWEELDANLLPHTKEAEREALAEFHGFHWKQDCSLHVYTNRYMQLLNTVMIHKGPEYMSDEELRDHYLRRVNVRQELLEQVDFQMISPGEHPSLRGVQDFLGKWDSLQQHGLVIRPVANRTRPSLEAMCTLLVWWTTQIRRTQSPLEM